MCRSGCGRQKRELRCCSGKVPRSIYVCGSSAVGEAAKDMVKEIYKGSEGEKKAEEWFEEVKRERYYSDAFT